MHAAIEEVYIRIRDDLVGGAADMARETAAAMAAAAAGSPATDRAAFLAELAEYSKAILTVSPSIAPVTNVLHQVLASVEALPVEAGAAACREAVQQAANWALSALDSAGEKVARIGRELVTEGEVAFLFSMSSTVWRIMKAARAQGKQLRGVTTEARPGGEGSNNLSALNPVGIPVSIGYDCAMGQLLKGCTSLWIGADTVTSTGATLAKVGSLPCAIVAQSYGIPVYIATDLSKFDPLTVEGIPLRIRRMNADHLLPEGRATALARVDNPMFEVLPPAVISAIVTDRGIIHPAAAVSYMGQMASSRIVLDQVLELTK